MSALLTTSPDQIGTALQARRMPRWATLAIAAGSVLLSYLVFFVAHLLGGGLVLTVVGAVVIFLIASTAAARAIEGGRSARNRLATSLIYSAFVLALLPLVSVVATLVGKGLTRLDGDFFNHSMRNITAFDANGVCWSTYCSDCWPRISSRNVSRLIEYCACPAPWASSVSRIPSGRPGLSDAARTTP